MDWAKESLKISECMCCIPHKEGHPSVKMSETTLKLIERKYTTKLLQT